MPYLYSPPFLLMVCICVHISLHIYAYLRFSFSLSLSLSLSTTIFRIAPSSIHVYPDLSLFYHQYPILLAFPPLHPALPALNIYLFTYHFASLHASFYPSYTLVGSYPRQPVIRLKTFPIAPIDLSLRVLRYFFFFFDDKIARLLSFPTYILSLCLFSFAFLL